MGEFRDYVEGVRLDALTHAVKVGVKAYRTKLKKDQEKSEKKKIEDNVLSAEGDDLKQIIDRMVQKDYKLKDGKVSSEPRVKHFTDWLKECTTTKMESTSEKPETLTLAL